MQLVQKNNMLSFFATLKKKEKLTSNIYKYIFKVDDTNLDFKSGQFIMLHLPNKVKRAYSIASVKNDLNEFSLIVEIIPNGLGSTFFFGMEVSDSAEFSGPFGKFILPEEVSDELYFIATGTGIAPIASMIEDLVISKRYIGRKIHLIFGTQTSDKLFYKDWATNLLLNGFIASYDVYLSRETSKEENIHEGYLTNYFEDNIVNTNAQFFICGSNHVVKAVVDKLTLIGVSDLNLYQERYG